MRYFQQPTDADSASLVVEADGTWYDLTAADADLDSFRRLARTASIIEESVDAVTRRRLEDAPRVDPDDTVERALPAVPSEVWAAGVTYAISEEAREAESGKPEMYLDVYEADRPEIFLKATPNRTVGPNDAVGVRRDSEWNVPEPELGVVLYRGSVVGYTIGNDVSSRSIEGANPLYLPQAKVYDRCCSLGPCIASPETVGDPHELDISMEIERDGHRVFSGDTSTGEMVRSCEDLLSYLTKHNDLPDLCVLLTGTSLVPGDDFTLRPGDAVRIDIERIGTLHNQVVSV